jgi:hypothetical protein
VVDPREKLGWMKKKRRSAASPCRVGARRRAALRRDAALDRSIDKASTDFVLSLIAP